jgi:hypothetical protein
VPAGEIQFVPSPTATQGAPARPFDTKISLPIGLVAKAFAVVTVKAGRVTDPVTSPVTAPVTLPTKPFAELTGPENDELAIEVSFVL